ncbi:MAG: protease SohB [Gammaproteobacteria bacterium]|nr:MAG: protease SohB [Gammaproteobacteria bacterium]
MEFLADYGLFLAKTVTLLIALAVAVAIIAGASRRDGKPAGLKVEKLNERYREMARTVKRAVLSKRDFRQAEKSERKDRKKQDKAAQRKRYFVLDFKGDIRATAVAHLREEISAVLSIARPEDEVVLRLENPGGAVHEHGLAASQLMRLKKRGIPLTVVVDKVAASGGYLMACIADRIVAAPFAVIGSIGVIAQLPNFNRALREHGVEFEQVTAGKYKRTLTMFGENTEEGRAKLREELEEVHGLFKALVAEHRPVVDVDSVATGEHWYGSRALELKLVDELGSSDDYLLDAAAQGDLYQVSWKGKPNLQEKILSMLETAAERLGLGGRRGLQAGGGSLLYWRGRGD